MHSGGNGDTLSISLCHHPGRAHGQTGSLRDFLTEKKKKKVSGLSDEAICTVYTCSENNMTCISQEV